MFGAALNKPTGGGLFSSSMSGNPQPTGTSLFSGLGSNPQQNQQQQGGGMFGNLGQNNQQNQQQGGGLFGQSTQQPQQQTGGLFGGLGQNAQQGGGLFSGFGQNTGQQNQQQQGGGLFGQNNQQNQTGGLFNQSQQQQGGGLFGGSTFNQSTQQPLPQLGQSQQALWQPSNFPREKTIPQQMATVLEKWDTGSPNCVFKHYFYNKVDDNMAPYYRPTPGEDPTAWEEALSKKPGPGYIPVLCTGFQQMGERIQLQQRNLANFNARLHEINNSLSQMMQNHETKTSIRAMDARRKHIVLKQRCLALATKVQVLRNRGYAMAGDEEDLRTKLMILEKNIHDPGLDARGEEIWARMLLVQERARMLKTEFDRAGNDNADVLDEETSNKAKKILEDYNTQLQHLKAEVESISKELAEWQKDKTR
ncbi:hypothetical protein BDZ45DRAFT_718483 [Acephala macrosclerotiorum]|nr:hypothetical protein BDZ45DRAFT_718483 [Acephala macrosclerotiorum]